MSLYRRGRIWWCEWRVKGKPVRESTGTDDHYQAQEYHDRRRAEIWRETRLGERPATTWDEATLAWLNEHACHKASYRDDLLRLRWLQPRLTGLSLRDITTDLLIRLRDKKRADTSAATANRHLAIVSAVMHHAHAKDQIVGVPKIPYLKESRGRIRYLTRDEAARLLGELPPHLEAMARLTLATGLRRSNITSLRWQNIDLSRRIAWVWPDEAKAGQAIGVPLNDAAIAVLQGQIGQSATWVFVWRGKPVRETGTKAFKAACSRAGIEAFNWHDLRHTWATWHVMAETPLEVLQKLGGWADFGMVLRYAHLAPNYLAGFAGNVGAVPHKSHTVAAIEISGTDCEGASEVGWLMGLEPTTTGITIPLKRKNRS
jgi:integrase